MALTIFTIIAWLSVFCFACLPRKLPTRVNVLIYFGLSIIDINKFTLFSYRYQFYEISKEVPGFLAAVIHRDITFSMTMLAFANAFWCTSKTKWRILAAGCTFLFIFLTGQGLRVFKVLVYKNWGIPQEMLLIITIMVIALILGRAFQAMAAREEPKLG